MSGILSHSSWLTPSCLLHTMKIAEPVLPYVFKIAIAVSLFVKLVTFDWGFIQFLSCIPWAGKEAYFNIPWAGKDILLFMLTRRLEEEWSRGPAYMLWDKYRGTTNQLNFNAAQLSYSSNSSFHLKFEHHKF